MRPVGVVALVGLMVLSGCGTAEQPDKPVDQAPATFTVHGRLTLKDAGTVSPDGKHCVGDAAKGYLDITAGTRVTILNATSRKVGTGRLRSGQPREQTCTFPFRVHGVPATGTMYFVRVGTRPRKVRFARVGSDLVTVTMGGSG